MGRLLVSGAALLVPALTVPLAAQEPPIPRDASAEPVVIGEAITLRSEILDEERRVLIHLPAGYERSSGRYPVLYLLDGGGHFHHVTGIIRFLTYTDRIPDMIVVGVTNTDRDRDFKPAARVTRHTEDLVPFGGTVTTDAPTAGGADRFLRFLVEELAPHVEARYRVADFRLLVGHSAGGLFALHSLLTRPSAFDAVIAVSPSLWWDDAALVKRAAGGGLPDFGPRTRFLYMAVGEEGGEMIGHLSDLASNFELADPSGLRWWYRIMPGETHASMPHRTIYDGLETIFSDYATSETLVLGGDIARVERRFVEASRIYGYEIAPPERLIEEMGEVQLRLFHRPEKAVEIFRRAVELYPESPDAQDNLADALMAVDRPREALPYREQALRKALAREHPRVERFRAKLDALRASLGSQSGADSRDSAESGTASAPSLLEGGDPAPYLAAGALDNRMEPIALDPWPADVPAGDTVRYTAIVNGMTAGERLMWRDGPDAWAYSYDMGRSGFPRTEHLALDAAGLPIRLEISGQKTPWAAWDERFERRDGAARWTTTVDDGERPITGAAYYAALHPAHDPGVLARALLRRPSGRLPLLPAGAARLEALGERTITSREGSRTVHHYAVHGLDLKPAYVWLDQNGATFADEWTVRAGWESTFPELKVETRAALADHVRRLAERLVPPPRDQPLAVRGARLFDPATGTLRSGTTILIEGNRIASVGADGSFEIPADAQVIDAAGRTVLPGLWDMHTHHGTSLVGFFRYRELDAPLHLAGGVTTARDLGSHIDELTSLRSRIDSGEAVGPRLLAAGYIDGVGGSRTGVQVATAEEARAAVDRFAELGYVQIKIYGQLPAELVPVVIERADRHGLRVSGHIPESMSGRDAVEAGFDELQHIGQVMTGMLGSSAELIERVADGWTGWAEALADLQPGSETVREFVELLAAHGVAIDPTLALAEASEVPPEYLAPVLDRFPPQARRRLLDRFWSPHPEGLAHRDAFRSNRMGFVHAAHEAGVVVLPGTDLMPGFGLHRELELYVDAGIPAPEVLGLATIGAARAMGMDEELGSIEPGKLADLILVDGDPTADISDIRRVVTVIKDGRVYDPAAIYRALGIRPCCED